MNRRELIQRIAAGTATLMVVPAVLTSCEDEEADPDDPNGDPDPEDVLTIDLDDDKYSTLGGAGGWVQESGLIIINTGSGYIALSSACTHQGCTVSYNHSSGELPCPCHGSKFSTSGSVLQGPAETPLKTYEVQQEDDVLTIDLG
jgi:cytochrome b6-f complex iron-sulfur subunit